MAEPWEEFAEEGAPWEEFSAKAEDAPPWEEFSTTPAAPAQNMSISDQVLDVFAQYAGRVGRRVGEASEELNTGLFEGLPKLITSLGADGKMDTLKGIAAPFKALTSPIDAAGEQAARGGLRTSEESARTLGDFTSAVATLPISLAAQANKLGAMPEAVLNAMGLVTKAGAAKGAGLADQARDMRKLQGEDWAQGMADEIAFQADLRPQARAVNLDPEGMQRTSSILDAAQQTVVPKPGHLDLNAGMETGRGFLERPMPKGDDFFRTTQESIEEATGGIGNRNAQDLLREKQLASDAILQDAITAKQQRELKMQEYLLSGEPDALRQAMPKRDLLSIEETTAHLLHGNVADEVAKMGGKSGELGKYGAWLKGVFHESTKMIAEMGPAGKILARDTVEALDKGVREAGTAVTQMQKLIKPLRKNDLDQLVEVLDKGAAPMNPEVARAAEGIRALFADVARRSYASGMTIKNAFTGEVLPWSPHPGGNYFPHFLLDMESTGDSRFMAKAVEQIKKEAIRSGKVISDGEARNMLDYMLENGQKRFGKLEMARLFNWSDFDRDVERVLTRYLDGSYKRLNLVEQFGADYKRADDLVQMIGTGGNTDYAVKAAQNYIDRITGREVQSSVFGDLGMETGKLLRHIEVATKLGQAVIANLSQTALTAVVAGFKPTIAAIKEARSMGGKEFAGLTGATLDSSMAQIMEGLNRTDRLGKLSTGVLKYSGFSRVERMNRTIAANAGRIFAEDLFSKYKAGLQNGSSRTQEYRRHLEKMGINVAEAIGRGSLSLDDQLKAGQSIVKRTQFQTGVADLPLFATSPVGRMVMQFKSFAFKSAQMVKSELYDEIKRGNWAPVARAALVLPVVGEVVNYMQATVNGKTRPENALERLVDDLAAVGTLGIWYQAWRAVDQGPGAIANMGIGVAAGDFTSGVANAYQAMQGNPDAFARQTLRNIPIVGPMVSNRLFPTREEQRRNR